MWSKVSWLRTVLSNRNIRRATNVSCIYNLKFFITTLKKETGEISNIFIYVDISEISSFQHIINIKYICERFYVSFFIPILWKLLFHGFHRIGSVVAELLVAQTVKHLPVMWETWVQSLGGEDPLEKGMATYSSILVWKIPQVKEPWWGYSPWSSKESDMTERLAHTRMRTPTHTHTHTYTHTYR